MHFGTIATLYKRYVDHQSIEVNRLIWKAPIVVRRHPISGLDLIPCDIDLLGEDDGGGQIAGSFPTAQALQQDSQRYLRELSFIRTIIDETGDTYQWVIIDCPPNLYLMTQNALHASDYYVVTAIPDHLSTIGLNILTKKVAVLGERVQPLGRLLGRTTPALWLHWAQ